MNSLRLIHTLFTATTLAAIFLAAISVDGQAHAAELWTFSGELEADPNVKHIFDRAGDAGEIPALQQAKGMVASFVPVASADPVRHQLKSGAEVQFTLTHFEENGTGFTWKKASAIGQASASYGDQLTVDSQASGTTGFLRFDWNLDGKLSALVDSDPGFYDVAYEVGVNLLAITSGTGSSSRVVLFEDSLVRGQISNPGLFVSPPIPVNPGLKLDPSVLGQERSHDLGTLSKSVLVPFQVGVTVDVSFHLFSGVGLAAEALDTGALDLTGTSEFTNTATLSALTVLDESMRPFAAPFNLVSANGLNYPLTTVPEPQSWAMMLAGFCLIGGMARQRLGRERGLH